MSLEVSADSFVHPKIGRSAVPDYRPLEPAVSGSPASQETKGRPVYTTRTGNEVGERAYLDTPQVDLSFGEFLDVLNPLQHIPVVSSIYREATGDQISSSARVLGGFLYGGPAGLLLGSVNGVIQDASGKDLGDHLYAALTGEGGEPAHGAVQAAGLEPKAGHDPEEGPLSQENASLQHEGRPAVASFTAAPPALSGTDALQAFLIDLQSVGAAGHGPAKGIETGDDGANPVLKQKTKADRGGPDGELPLPSAPSVIPNRHASGSRADGLTFKGYSLEGVSRTTRVNSRGPSQAELHESLPSSRAAPAAASRQEADEQPRAVITENPGLDGEEVVPARMLEALQKYETMLQRRRGDSGDS